MRADLHQSSGEPAPPGPTFREAVVRSVPVGLRRRLWYRKKFGRRLRTRTPETFTDKVNWRILKDRRPVLLGTCDKLWMKEHASSVAPGLVRVPRTYWSGTDLAELASVDLPERWVLKPNHTSKLVHLGEGPPDLEHLRALTAGWLEQDLASRTGEWAYSTARPLLLVEEFIGDGLDDVPADYKLYVFDGVPRLFQVHSNRFVEHESRVYTTDWEPLPWDTGYPPGPALPRPQRADGMLAAAAALAQGFDMMRVDLYEHDGVLWFGELTPYPGSGLIALDPEMDRALGGWWQLPSTTR